MTHYFAIMYAVASVATIVGCLPQVIQVFKTKNVEGISLQTYELWLIFQLLSIPYIYQSGDIMWIAANLAWTAYYVLMIILIQVYRYPHYIRVAVSRFVKVLKLIPVPSHIKNQPN